MAELSFIYLACYSLFTSRMTHLVIFRGVKSLSMQLCPLSSLQEYPRHLAVCSKSLESTKDLARTVISRYITYKRRPAFHVQLIKTLKLVHVQPESWHRVWWPDVKSSEDENVCISNLDNTIILLSIHKEY